MAAPWEDESVQKEVKAKKISVPPWEDISVAESPMEGIPETTQGEWERAKQELPGELKRGAIRSLPMIGGIGGGLAGLLAGPFSGLAGGALGSAAGKSLEQVIAQEYAPEMPEAVDLKRRLEEAQSPVEAMGEIIAKPVEEGAWGALFEGLGQGVGYVAEKGIAPMAKSASEGLEALYQNTKAAFKKDKSAIIEAGEKVGVKPTRGMMTDNTYLQKLESGLSQGKTLPAQEIHGEAEAFRKSLGDAENRISGMEISESAYDVGNRAKENIEQVVDSYKEPVSEMYSGLEKELHNIPIDDGIKTKVMGQLKKKIHFKTKEGAEVLAQIEDDLDQLTNLADLKEYRTNLLRSLPQGAAPIESIRIDDVYEAVTKIRDNSINAYKDIGVHASALEQPEVKAVFDMFKERYPGMKKADFIKVIKSGKPYYNVPNKKGFFGEFPVPNPLYNGENIGVNRVVQATEDPFQWADTKFGTSKAWLDKNSGRPKKIHTSSDLIARDDYMNLLNKDDEIYIYSATNNVGANRIMFPGNPSNARLEKAVEKLQENGYNARIVRPTLFDVAEGVGSKFGDVDKFAKSHFGADDFASLEKDLQLNLPVIMKEHRQNIGTMPSTEAYNQVIDQINLADKAHAENMNRINSVKGVVGQRKPFRSQDEFIQKLDETPSEQMTQKVFGAKVSDVLNFSRNFPDAFKQLKLRKVSDMIQKAYNNRGWNFTRFHNEYSKLNPEIRDLLFDAEMQDYISALNVIKKNVPEYLGPSGTPEGIALMDTLNPARIANDMWNKYLLKNSKPEGIQSLKTISGAFSGLADSITSPIGNTGITKLQFGSRSLPQIPRIFNFGSQQEKDVYIQDIINNDNMSIYEKAEKRTKANKSNSAEVENTSAPWETNPEESGSIDLESLSNMIKNNK